PMTSTGSEALASTVSAVEAALRASDMPKAMRLSEEAVGTGAVHPTLLSLTAMKRMQAGDNDGALPLLLRARELAPHHADLLNALGTCFSRLGRPREAVEAFDAALTAAPRDARLHMGRALVLEDLSELDAARAGFEQVLVLSPSSAAALSRLAVLAVQRGDATRARELAARALAIDPRDAAAAIAFAQASLQLKDIFAAEQMVAALSQQDLGPVNRAFALSLAGDVLDAQNRVAEAFVAYGQSKQVLREAYAPYMAKVESVRARETRLAEYFRRADGAAWHGSAAAPERTHIFLVGFPRSGTTLLGQVLASHPDVQTMEERTCLMDSAAAFFSSDTDLDRLAALSESDLDVWRARYWERVAESGMVPSKPVFVDKMPLNAIFLPLIAKLFPQARILCALRDPRDVILSCFRRRFAMNAGMYEFTRLETAVAYYGAVMRLMQIYGEKLSLPTFEARHESLVADFAGEAKRLCAFLGLAYRDEMAGFASRAQTQNIDTPSSAQVARGLSDAGVAQWRRYARELEPVLPVLAPFVAQHGYPEN
ncbi:MAG TPA: sulfotransferase, partial [Rhizomicrobium sp.]|nr:sulfotransferase [Rhizomicrobium sp.]